MGLDLTGAGSIANLLTTVVNKIWKDPAQQAEAQLKIQELLQSGELARLTAETDLLKGQQAINLEDAKSGKLWQSGARPFVMWVCGSSLAWNYIVYPFLCFGAVLAGYKGPAFPILDTGNLMPLLVGLLGLAGMRSYDKKNGKADD